MSDTAKQLSVGDEVEWKWGQGKGRGKISRVFTDNTEVTIKGTQVKRNASSDEPAYLIKQDDGDEVFKSHSEVDKRR